MDLSSARYSIVLSLTIIVSSAVRLIELLALLLHESLLVLLLNMAVVILHVLRVLLVDALLCLVHLLLMHPLLVMLHYIVVHSTVGLLMHIAVHLFHLQPSPHRYVLVDPSPHGRHGLLVHAHVLGHVAPLLLLAVPLPVLLIVWGHAWGAVVESVLMHLHVAHHVDVHSHEVDADVLLALLRILCVSSTFRHVIASFSLHKPILVVLVTV